MQEKGFYGSVPLTRRALQDWVEGELDNFAVVPGADKTLISYIFTEISNFAKVLTII